MSKFSAIKHLTKENIIKNGSIFTPAYLVEMVKQKCSKYITPNTTILELGSGYGAFISVFKSSGAKIIGTDYDATSVMLLQQEFPDITFHHENSLLNVNRNKYGIAEEEELIIIGNPPYNDITSAYHSGKKGTFMCDQDLMSRDLGVSFLKAYDKLHANYVCVLHPLSYLIKKQNFKNLGSFRTHYRLIDATIFSSKEFESIRAANSDFPVVAALYERCDAGMQYDDIYNFEFSIFRAHEKFCLRQFTTIDGIMQKCPRKGPATSIQFYILRDINSLKRNAAFVNGPITNGINVTIDNLYQYSWLLFLRDNFTPPRYSFIYGNLSPLYSPKIELPHIQNLLVSYAYHKNSIVRNNFSLDTLEAKYGKITNHVDYDELLNIIEEMYL